MNQSGHVDHKHAPRATMRLQLHKGFTFADASALIPYLVELGISHVYSSPILTATPGSIHGYDVIDPTTVNPELGGEAGFRDFAAAVHDAGLGLIVDIVPNHMAVGVAGNHWWNDLLQHGRSSRYSEFFDVDWETNDPDLRGKVFAPFLGKPYGQALDEGELTLAQAASGDPVVRYFDNEYPINPADYAFIATNGVDAFGPAGRDLLHTLLERQNYRLAWWATAGDEINWRRFFDINGLAGLRIEVPEVFEATHATLFRLFKDGLIDGFRVDHVDGLSDPPGYCRRLRQRLQDLQPDRHAYLVIEKILGAGEALPRDWGVDGTSGYDFMNEVSALQHDPDSKAPLEELWHDLTHRVKDFESEEVPARHEILDSGFGAQLMSVTRALHKIARANRETRDFSEAKIRQGLIALLSHFPVYRGYDAGSKRSAMDQKSFGKALTAAKQASPNALHAVLDQLDLWLGGAPGDAVANTRFQQLSAPVAAKSVEDTAFYRYGRLLSRNDVGFDAARLGSSVADFHKACADRLSTFPDAMLATATHDHKRGEDMRARLAVISEIPSQWQGFVEQCQAIDAKRPSAADEVMLYQMIVGAWPPELKSSDSAGLKGLAERLSGWQEKALREAKLHTSWTDQNAEYEAAAKDFLFKILTPQSPFLKPIESFIETIAPAGAVNGLSQALLKMTVPGMPDFYQGTEFWDFSLVDPDNRRPVDYDSRRSALGRDAEPGAWRDGRIKQAMIRKVLGIRQQAAQLFARGDYSPLPIKGPLETNFVAFTRTLENAALLVVVPRLVYNLLHGNGTITLNADKLRGNAVGLPEQLHGRDFKSLLDGDKTVGLQAELPLDSLFGEFPMAVLYST